MEFTRLNPTTLQIAVNKINIVIGPDIKTGDVQLVTHHGDKVSDVDMNVRRFDGPGEYEAQGVMIDAATVGESAISYHVLFDGMALAAMTIPALVDLTDEVVERMQPANVLCVWLESGTPQDMATIMGRFESAIVIPIALPFSAADSEKELQTKTESMPKLKLSAKDILSDQRRLIDLE